MEQAMLEYLANALWQLPVLAAGAWVLLWLMKPGPQTQYRVWLAVLGLGVVLPACGIRGGEIAPVPGAAFDQLAAARIIQRSSAVVVVDTTAPVAAASVPIEAGDTAGGDTAEGDRAKQMWQLPFRVQQVHLSAKATHWAMGVYAGSVLLGLLRVIRAWRTARRLVESSREVALCSAAEAVLKDFGGSFGVRLPEVRECALVTSPMVVGALSPVVLLPQGFAGHAENEVRAALLHELAHVKRRDYLTNGICQLAGLPVGWHPVTYGVQQRIRRTREMVCDEMAAREMNSELGYARCLLTMARGMLGGGLAERTEFVGLFSNNVLEERVMRLTETKTALSVRTKLVRLTSGATAMAAATLVAASFHVVPTMAAESPANVPAVRTVVLGSADAPVVAPLACTHRLAKPAVAPVAPVSATPVVAPVMVAPIAVAWATPVATPQVAPVASPAPQSAPAAAPPAPVATPATSAVAPVAPVTAPAEPGIAAGVTGGVTGGITADAPIVWVDEDHAPDGKKNTYVYRMKTLDGRPLVIINGSVRDLTPEERQQIDKAMALSAESMKKAMEAFKNGDFAEQMAGLNQEIAKLKLKDTFDSPEFRTEMEAAKRAMAQSAWVNNAELQAKVKAMVKNLDVENMAVVHCKDGAVKEKAKDKDKQKQKDSADPQMQ
jgi:beta-lactamase regulating signal transducer with metallopeptidase domain